MFSKYYSNVITVTDMGGVERRGQTVEDAVVMQSLR